MVLLVVSTHAVSLKFGKLADTIRPNFLELSSTDKCKPMGFDGKCAHKAQLASSLESLWCKDTSACFAYKTFVKPLVEAAVQLGYNLPTGCLGDFTGSQTQNLAGLKDVGCAKLPLVSSLKYGIYGFTIPLTLAMQTALKFTSTEPLGYKDTFCIAYRGLVKDCPSAFTVALNLNKDSLKTMVELGPKAPYATIVSEAIKAGLMSFGTGISTNGEFVMKTPIYDENGWNKEAEIKAHFFYTLEGDPQLPFLTGDAKKVATKYQLFRITGWFKEWYMFGSPTEAVKQFGNLFNAGSANPTSFLSGFERGIHISGTLKVGLSAWTDGVVGDLSMDLGEALMYMTGSGNGVVNANVKAGLYMNVRVANMLTLVKEVCKMFEGILKDLGFGSCPSFKSNEAKFGLYIQKDAAGFEFKNISTPLGKWTFACSISKLFTNTKVKCSLNNSFFSIIADAIGYVIKALANQADKVGKVIMKVGKGALGEMKGFSKMTLVTAVNVGKVFSKYGKKLENGVRSFFSGGAEKHKEKSFNFKTRYKCRGTTRTMFDAHVDSTWINDYRDDSRGECYNQCYLYFKTLSNPGSANNCCMYDKAHKARNCRAGTAGRQGVDSSGHNKEVSMSVWKDFTEQLNAKDDGATCGKHTDCSSGFCTGGICKTLCDEAYKCAEGEANTYCNADSQCNAHCHNNKCYDAKWTDGTLSTKASSCTSGYVRDGRCYTRCKKNAKCYGGNQYQYCSSQDQCHNFCYQTKCYDTKFANGVSSVTGGACQSGFQYNNRCRGMCSSSNKCSATSFGGWSYCTKGKHCTTGRCSSERKCY